MANKSKKPAGEQPEAPISAPKAKKPRARSEASGEKTEKAAAKRKSAAAAEKAPAPKARKSKAKSQAGPAPGGPAEAADLRSPVELPPQLPVEDPIGDVSDGEGRFPLSDTDEPDSHAEMRAYRAETADDAAEGTLENRPQSAPASDLPSAAPVEKVESESESKAGAASTGNAEEGDAESRPESTPAKLERLQKILSQAGIASRRHAEEMIQGGRVMVNGQVVTQLGSKADPAHDHIRVDGKLIAGAERHRYFVLNKPKGYVTTASDPEGRPTVMQFFSKMRERLYPVGRLDYDSEGLLLVTNDGELANELTRAASGIEKTYLVKVAGQPTEEELERLRGGVSIERDEPGSSRVRTAPAEIRQVRQGDNPWFEVVLIEGRNRELRKMFQSIGHFVEKIRRVGYGPLTLDLEPGKLRELEPEEVAALRLAAAGKLKRRSPQAGPRRRERQPRRPDAGKTLPKETGRSVEERKAFEQRRPFEQRKTDRFEKRPGKPFEPRRFDKRPAGQRPFGGSPRGDKPFREGGRPAPNAGRFAEQRGEQHGEQRPFRGPESRPNQRPAGQRPFGGPPRGGRPFREGGRPAPNPGRFAEQRGEQHGEQRGERGPFRGPESRFNRRPAGPRPPSEGPRPSSNQSGGQHGERPYVKHPKDAGNRFEKPARKPLRPDERPSSPGGKPGTEGLNRERRTFGSAPRGFAPRRPASSGTNSGTRRSGFRGKPGAGRSYGGSRPDGRSGSSKGHSKGPGNHKRG